MEAVHRVKIICIYWRGVRRGERGRIEKKGQMLDIGDVFGEGIRVNKS